MWRELAAAAVAGLVLGLVIMVAESRIAQRPAASAPFSDTLSRQWSIGATRTPDVELFGDSQPGAFQLPRRWRRRIERHLEAGGQVELDSCGHDLVIHLRAGESI